jgi:hypothetical protein
VVVSSVQLDDTTQYRVVGAPDENQIGVSVKPGLEDGYMWLMRQQTSFRTSGTGSAAL